MSLARRICLELLCSVLLPIAVQGSDIMWSATTADSGSADWLMAADLDRDGDLDLVGTQKALPAGVAFFWLANPGSVGGTWVRHDVASVSMGPYDRVWALAVDDFELDGRVDVVVAVGTDTSRTNLLRFRNLGGAPPVFLESLLSEFAGDCHGLTTVDLDRDGDPDVVSTDSYAHTLSWHRNPRPGTSWTTQILSTSYADLDGAGKVHAGDLDGDGDPDLVVASVTFDRVTAFTSDGASSPVFTPVTVATGVGGAAEVLPVDIDGDGDLDLVSTAATGSRVSLHRNLGPGLGWSTSLVDPASPGCSQVVAADLDLDGDQDLVLGISDGAVPLWYENTSGDGSSWTRLPEVLGTVAGSAGLEAADLDGDGDVDVTSVGTSRLVIRVLESRLPHRSALYPEAVTAAAGLDGVDAVALGDLDGDGDLDVAVSSYADKSVRWLESDGHLGFIGHAVYTADGLNAFAETVALGDLDRDGDLDIVAGFSDGVSHSDQRVVWFRSDGGSPPSFDAPRIVDTSQDGPAALMVADVDRDAWPDLVVASCDDGQVRWYENQAVLPPAFTSRPVGSSLGCPLGISVADLDRDGLPDVAVAVRDSDLVKGYFAWGTSPPSWSPDVLTSAIAGPRALAVADLDGDTAPDVVVAGEQGNEVVSLSDDAGTGTWSTAAVCSGIDGAASVTAADLDRDGDLDVLTAALAGSELLWLASNGEDLPTFTAHTVGLTATGVRGAQAADLDGDGDLEVVAALQGADAVTVADDLGGNLAVTTDDIAPGLIIVGSAAPALRLTASHRGRIGDIPVALGSVRLRFESGVGVAMTSGEAGAVLHSVSVYHDSDHDGTFTTASDTLLASSQSFVLADGALDIALPGGAATVPVALGTPETYFVVVEVGSDLSGQPVTRLRLVHLTDRRGGASVSRVVDATLGIPLELEHAPAVASRLIWLGFEPLFADDLETADLSRWSGTSGG